MLLAIVWRSCPQFLLTGDRLSFSWFVLGAQPRWSSIVVPHFVSLGEDPITLSPVASALCEWNAPLEPIIRNNSKNREFDYNKSEKRERVMR